MNHYVDNDMVVAAVAGDEQSMSAIISSLMPCVEAKVSSVTCFGAITRHDLIQEGLLAVVRAVFSFDEKRDVKFNTYAQACISNAITSALRNQQRLKHSPLNGYVSLDEIELSGENPHDPEKVVSMAEEMEHIRFCMENELTELEYNVLMRHISGDSYEEIAQSIGVSLRSVGNALSRARKKLKAARNI